MEWLPPRDLGLGLGEEQAREEEAHPRTLMCRLAQDWRAGQKEPATVRLSCPAGLGLLAHHAQRAQGPLRQLTSGRAEDSEDRAFDLSRSLQSGW